MDLTEILLAYILVGVGYGLAVVKHTKGGSRFAGALAFVLCVPAWPIFLIVG